MLSILKVALENFENKWSLLTNFQRKMSFNPKTLAYLTSWFDLSSSLGLSREELQCKPQELKSKYKVC